MSPSDYDPKRADLWLAWDKYQGAAAEVRRKAAEHYFTQMRRIVCDSLVTEALTSARLAQKDEGIYDHLVYLMETYREVVSLFASQYEDAPPDLVGGLCDVLNSRLGQFDDLTLGGQGNPIAGEKRVILEKALVHLCVQIEDVDKDSIIPHQAWDGSVALHGIYLETLTRCQASIDDLYTRKTVSYYADLLESEWEVLGVIIQIQVQALEACHGNADEVHGILSKLREAYQQTGPIVSGLRKLMQSTTQATDVAVSYEDFVDMISTGVTAYPDTEINDQAFIAALLPEADALFEGLRGNHLELTSEIYEAIDNENALAKAVVSVFEKALEGLVLSLPPSQETQIITGINETLEIKIDSLNENMQAFAQAGQDLISSLAQSIPTLSLKDLDIAANQLKAAWLDNPPSPETVEDFFADCIVLEAFATYSSQFVKLITDIKAKAEKSALRFKKETLLYEISTYEEILYYSVTRLRESPHVADAVQALDETFAALEALLIENNIEIIRPAPHDPFNGREHEVLTAEETEGFTKGEIVKTMTSGYKSGEQIILRANVVAAR